LICIPSKEVADNQFICVFLCQSSKMSQMAYFSGYIQKYLFLTFILFSFISCCWTTFTTVSSTCHGGLFSCGTHFSTSLRGQICFYLVIYAKQWIFTCELNNTETLQYPYYWIQAIWHQSHDFITPYKKLKSAHLFEFIRP
jgi:hypothetical protein